MEQAAEQTTPKEKYCRFVDKLCEVMGITDDPTTMYEVCNVLINDVPFTLAQGDGDDEDSLYIYCDFGKPSDEAKAVVLERLMQTNLVMFGSNTPMFGLSAASGHVVLMHHMAISEM